MGFPNTIDFFNVNKLRKDGLHYYCKKCSKEKDKKFRDENKESCSGYSKKYWNKNKKKINTRIIERSRQRVKTDFIYRLWQNAGSRIYIAIKKANVVRKCSYRELLGCSQTELAEYIETLFTDGMTRDTYDRYGWWVDHIKPCNSFNLTTKEGQKECFNYKNFQPLWWWDNLSKGFKTF